MQVPGLVEVSEDELKRLLRAVHHEEIATPLVAVELACIGLGHRVEVIMEALRGLDSAAIRAIVVCVLAERR